jgi:uncharacterized protein involved in exopolysaccharide biosynthesis
MIIQVTPRAMLNTFFRRRYKFASVFLLVFGLAATYCIIRPPRYESDAALLVKFAPPQANQTTALPTTGIAAAQLERQQIINSQIAVLQSQDVLVDLLSTLTIRAIYPSLADIPDPKVRQDTALIRLNQDLDVEAAKNANIITLSLLNTDAGTGAKALGMLIDKFIAQQSKIYQSAQLPFMQEQLAQAREQLEKSRQAVQDFKASTGINSLDEERTLLLRQQTDAQESLTQAVSKQEEAQGRYQKIEEMLKKMPTDIKLSDENDRFKAVDDARQKVDDLLSRQKLMGDNYRSDSQTMKTLNAQLSFAQQHLAAASRESAARVRTGVNPVRQQAEVDLMTAASDQYGATASRASYEAALQRIGEKLGKLESQSQRLDALTLQQQVDEENFRNYLQAVNDARVTDDLNRQRISSIAVIQSPTVPVLPTRPRVKLILAGGFLLGLAGAITLTLLSEMFDEAFSTADQIETVLGLPVLGTFTMRRPAPMRTLPGYARLLPILLLLLGLTLSGNVFGFDQLDPAYGQRLVIRDSNGHIAEILSPKSDRFDRSGTTGATLGFAKRVGPILTFFDPEGRQTSTARRELMPPNYPINALAVVRDGSGNIIGVISRH